jgi:hypothetical protein
MGLKKIYSHIKKIDIVHIRDPKRVKRSMLLDLDKLVIVSASSDLLWIGQVRRAEKGTR